MKIDLGEQVYETTWSKYWNTDLVHKEKVFELFESELYVGYHNTSNQKF